MSEVAVQFKNILWDTFPGTPCMYLYCFVNNAKVCRCIICGWGHCTTNSMDWIEETKHWDAFCDHSSFQQLQFHHNVANTPSSSIQQNIFGLDCDLWCFLILRSADLGQTVHAAGANVQWLCNLLMVPPNIVFSVFLYCIVVLLMVPPNMDPHTKLPLLLGSSD